MNGTATHTMKVIENNTTVAQFDIWSLSIWEIYDGNGTRLTYRIQIPNPSIGWLLQVDLPRPMNAGEEIDIIITYITSPNGHAFSWLNGNQTAGGILPYMFT